MGDRVSDKPHVRNVRDDVARDRRLSDDQVTEMVRGILKEPARAAELRDVSVNDMSLGSQHLLMQLIAKELRGQLPSQVMQQLMGGQASPEVLQKLMDRLANSAADNQRYGQAPSADSARSQAADASVPQQALRWTQFVQKTQHVPGSQLQDRSGTAAPKGEGTTLAQLIAGHLRGHAGPGLRSPKLVERGLESLSPAQRDLLLRACVGEKLAGRLKELGIKDPIQLLAAWDPLESTCRHASLSIL